MQQSQPSTLPLKNYLYDSSSTISSRFARRQDQNLSSRKSHSKTSSEKSLAKVDLSHFYVKMHASHNSTNQLPTRKNIINRIQQPVTRKKRSPTPTPGHKAQPKPHQSQSIEPIETDLLIAQLQQKYQQQKDAKEMLNKQMVTLQKQQNLKRIKIQQLQRLYQQCFRRQQASQKKLQQYQSILAVAENDLHEARNNLQRLKLTMKQSKYAQIEADNTRLKNENRALKQNIQQIQSRIHLKDKQISTLQNQNRVLQSLNENLIKQSRIEEKNREIESLRKTIQAERTQKQIKLEHCLVLISQQNQSLKLKIDKLQIRLDLLHRKKNQEMQAMRDNKNELIGKLRKKISHLFTQYSNLRTECDKLKAKNLFCSIKLERKNMMVQDTSHDHALFDLTPQK